MPTAEPSTDFFRWVPHPEVWLLVGGLAVLYWYAARVIGPKVVPAGTPAVTRAQRRWFIAGLLVLWLASDWPVHDIGEEYLYLVHMVQHLLITLVMPPMMLLATPEWLARLIVGDGWVDKAVHKLARPVPAGTLLAVLTLATHAPVLVNSSVDNPLLHYGVHTVLVLAAVLFWIPVCGPFPELRISLPGQMIYLFVQSLVPTVPGAWMIFAEGAVYSTYDISARLWGITVTSDQQAAGAIMKLIGGTYLWVIIVVLFFRWAARHEQAHARGVVPSERDILTWDQVERAFSLTDAPAEERQQ